MQHDERDVAAVRAQRLPDVLRIGWQLTSRRGLEARLARQDWLLGRYGVRRIRHGGAQGRGTVASQLGAQWLQDIGVVRRRCLRRIGDSLEGPQPHHLVARRVEQGRGQRIECSRGHGRVWRIEQGAHRVDRRRGDVANVMGEQRADRRERPRIADALEHPEQSGLEADVGLAQVLQHEAQGWASDDGQPRNGRLDGHGVVAGQQFIEEHLGLTGAGRHERADCTFSARH